jgi:biotin carboxyl carrier protein
MKYISTINEQDYLIEIIDNKHIKVNDQIMTIDFQAIGDQEFYSLIVDGNSYEAFIYLADEGWQVILKGSLYTARVEDEREKQLRLASYSGFMPHGEFHLKAPMPGLIISLPVQDGQSVKKGEVLAILESMKMQNELRSPRDGVVSRSRVKIGDRVEQKQILLSVI